MYLGPFNRSRSCGEGVLPFYRPSHGHQQGCLCLQVNPLGHEVTLLSAVMLNLGQLLGSGIFSVPGVVLDSAGSVGLSLSLWIISPIFALGTWHSFASVLSTCC
jgi:hypothetical protein